MSENDSELKNRINKAANKVRLQGVGTLACGIFFLTIGYFSSSHEQQEFNQRMNNGNVLGVNIDKTPLKHVHDVSNGLMALMPVAFFVLGIASVGFGTWQLAVGIPKGVKQELIEEYELEQRVLKGQTNVTPANAENSENGVRFDGIYQYSAAGAPKPERFLRFFRDRTV